MKLRNCDSFTNLLRIQCSQMLKYSRNKLFLVDHIIMENGCEWDSLTDNKAKGFS